MKMLRKGAVALLAAGALMLTACGNGGGTETTPTEEPTASDTESETEEPTEEPAPEGATITLWVAGGDTPQELRDYLVDTFAEQNPGSTLVIEEQGWGDLVQKLTTSLPDPNNTPDVVEMGNTQAPTFTTVGAFRDLTGLYAELGGDDLLQSFVDVGSVDGTVYALPYYFGSRYVFYRPDIWGEAGVEVPATLGEFTDAVIALRTADMSGFAMGGQDWRNGISWVFAHGGELATFDGEWTMTLSDPNTIAGLQEWQQVVQGASNLPTTERDVAYWDFLNDGTDGEAPPAATIMAPGWARWSIGDLDENDNRDGMADESRFDIFGLPGVDGGLAPVFAGGSNIAISAASQNPELAENLLRIIFSEEYQRMLGANGLGPANTQFTDSLGDNKFAQTMIATAEASKLTPAAPGWAAIEGALLLEELFQKIADGGDVPTLAAEYDAILTPMLNING